MRLFRILRATCVLALLCAVLVVRAGADPAPPAPAYTGPTTDLRAELDRAVQSAQEVAWYEWADAQARWYAWAADHPRPSSAAGGAVSRDGSVWDRIAACESGGNWADNTGNGYLGGLQENMAFWHSYGGDEFAARPDLATREQQITVAERARDSGRGYGPWPQCGRLA